ncbi:hypothetical protein K488DRAFT_67506 [Vararia minispora EC-137]|uniref:Uncharacterized protein n=1 Tax=Vararia minispora EC-137 TaxID=1314806 RepID=A0ACB8QYS4_9AGAM|nr:hypothetical protein K488DRAFT_67506 [Vararia minispora EC-137]
MLRSDSNGKGMVASGMWYGICPSARVSVGPCRQGRSTRKYPKRGVVARRNQGETVVGEMVRREARETCNIEGPGSEGRTIAPREGSALECRAQDVVESIRSNADNVDPQPRLFWKDSTEFVAAVSNDNPPEMLPSHGSSVARRAAVYSQRFLPACCPAMSCSLGRSRPGVDITGALQVKS